MDRKETENARRRALTILQKANIVITDEEYKKMEITDFGLNNINKIGLEIVVYINTKRVCAKELVLFPLQICPQHKHPPIKNSPGKEETFRLAWEKVYLYVPGDKTSNLRVNIPEEFKNKFSVFNETTLKPGDQYTIYPDTWHWFQAGKEGAIISEFSTRSTDENDIFYDKKIIRVIDIHS